MKKNKTSIMMSNLSYFDFVAENVEDIDIECIAHALAMTNRFGGHTRVPYSVAQHSYYVSKFCDPEVAREGLLHDASEAFINDIVKPAKDMLPCYKEMEERLTRLIYERFNVPYPEGGMSPSVLEADMRMCVTESRSLIHPTEWQNWNIQKQPYDFTIRWWKLFNRPWGWRRSKKMFLKRARELGID